MSSRVYRPEDGVRAAPIAWRHTGHAFVQPVQPGPDDGEQSLEARIQSADLRARAEGEAAGLERAMQRLEPVIAQLNSMLRELAAQRPRLRMEAEEDTVKLAIAIARRVLHRELATDPDAILGLVKAAFAKLNAREAHRLRVCPAVTAALQENRGRLELPTSLEIVSDASLLPGGAVFETSRGELDASVDTQLAEIDRGLADIVKRRLR